MCDGFLLGRWRMAGKRETGQRTNGVTQCRVAVDERMDVTRIRDLCSSNGIVAELAAERVLKVMVDEMVFTE